jgi:1-acyl-sn-glycerol-3-phosphate acyltransferase
MIRLLRYTYRIPLLLLNACVGLPILLLMLYPWTDKLTVSGERVDQWIVGLWSRIMVRIFGLKMKRFGTPLPGAVLFVANHVSWLDITVLHSQRWMGFVAKAEIEQWPIIGGIAKRSGTIYHQRGDNASLHGVMHQMLDRLQNGMAVGVFPEGKTLPGNTIGVFHARIFQPAIVADKPAQPVAIKYGDKGNAQTLMAFGVNENFFSNMIRVLGEPSRVCEVHFLEPIAPNEEGRRKMADTCRQRIVDCMALQ